MTFWHGGKPGIKGGWVLPPDETGEVPVKAYVEDQDTSHVRTDMVYVTNDRYWADFYAAWYPAKSGGWVYEVEPEGDMTPDPDWLGTVNDRTAPNPAFYVARARIVRRFTLARARREELLVTTQRPFALVPAGRPGPSR